MHLAQLLEISDWEGIRNDLDKRPIEGINGKSREGDILNILQKYGIKVSMNDNPAGSLTINEIRNSSLVISNSSHVLRPSSIVTLTLWGTGKVFREFMHVDDMAKACVKVLEELNMEDILQPPSSFVPRPSSPVTFLNIGTGEDQTIAEIAALIKSVVGFTGEILWDNTKPDGTMEKLLDVSKLRTLGVTGFLSLEEGINSVYNHYISNHL